MPGEKSTTINIKGHERATITLDKLQNSRIDPKTGDIYANDKDYNNKTNRIRGMKLMPKTREIEADHGKYRRVLGNLNGVSINAKSGSLYQ